GRRLLAPDVLFASRQGEVEAAPALGIVRRAHQPAGQLAHQLATAGDEADVRPAVTRCEPELLALPDRYVSAELTWRGQPGQAWPAGAREHEGAGGRARL